MKRVLRSWLGAGLALLAAVGLQEGTWAVDGPLPTPPRFLMVSGITPAEELQVPSYQNVTRLPARPEDRPTGSSHPVLLAVPLQGVSILNGEGKPLTLAEGRRRVTREMPILVMSNGERPAAAFLKLLARDALVFVFPKEAPRFTPPQWPVEKPKEGNKRVSRR